jgi:hypothetical protein
MRWRQSTTPYTFNTQVTAGNGPTSASYTTGQQSALGQCL